MLPMVLLSLTLSLHLLTKYTTSMNEKRNTEWGGGTLVNGWGKKREKKKEDKR